MPRLFEAARFGFGEFFGELGFFGAPRHFRALLFLDAPRGFGALLFFDPAGFRCVAGFFRSLSVLCQPCLFGSLFLVRSARFRPPCFFCTPRLLGSSRLVRSAGLLRSTRFVGLPHFFRTMCGCIATLLLGPRGFGKRPSFFGVPRLSDWAVALPLGLLGGGLLRAGSGQRPFPRETKLLGAKCHSL